MTARYELEGGPSASLDKVVLDHAELVKRIAYHLVSKMPPHVEVDDLIQAGMIGLLNAAQNYSASEGANFETYAGIRIRGAMLDEARKVSWTPRSTVRQARQISDAIREVEGRTGRSARASEVAETMGLALDDYHRVLENAASSRLMSFDEIVDDPERTSGVPASPGAGPEGEVEDERFRAALADAIACLPEREQLVLSLYYDDELNLREIGEVLGVTESRVCQIHSQAVLRIRARLDASWVEAGA